MDPYGHVGTVLVPARAHESRLFVAYVNSTGTEGPFTYCGASCLVSPPEGTDLARAGRGEELLLAEVDPAVLASSHAVNTHLADRRPELYRTPEPTA
jgi:5-aminopentanamidase